MTAPGLLGPAVPSVLTAVGPLALAMLLAVGARPIAVRSIAVRCPDRRGPDGIGVAVPGGVLGGAVAVAVAGLAGRLPVVLVPLAVGLVAILVVGAAVDIATRRIPAPLTAWGAATMLIGAIAAALASSEIALRHVILGAVVPALVLEALACATAALGHGRGIGRGDVRLAVAIGPVVAAVHPLALVVLALGTLASATVPAVIARRRHGPGATIALAPPLALGSVVALVGGRPLASDLEQALRAVGGS